MRTERVRRLSREGVWILLGQVLAVAGLLVGVRLTTEMLDAGEYGELALGMTLAILINQIVLGPLLNGVTRFYTPAAEQGELRGYLRAVRRLFSESAGIIALVAVLTFAGLLITGRAQWIALAAAAFVFAMLSGYSSILNAVQNAARRRSIVALHQGAESWARFGAAAVLMLSVGATSSAAMAGYAMGSALVLCSQYLFLRKINQGDQGSVDASARAWRRSMWEYSWPFSAYGMFTWAQLASDRWALELFSTTGDVGLYAVLFQLGTYPVAMATTMAMQLFIPILYQRAGDGTDRRRNAGVNRLSWRLGWMALGVTGVAFLLSLVLHGLIFRIFVAPEYRSVSHLLPWMMLAGGAFAAGQAISFDLMSQMKTRKLIPVKVVTGMLGIAANFAGAYWYGVAGVVGAAIVFSISYLVWMAALSKHEAGGERR
ncbi:MAG: lipopolysaccharide biosynthesis protein [Gemmatimonadaceae bacterium]